MKAGPDGPMVKNYGGALNMGKHTKTKTGKHTGPGGEPTKGPHAHKDGETSASGNPKMGTMSIKKTMPRMEKGADLSPYDSKPKGRIKKAIKKFVSKVREKRDEKKGCKHGDCGAYA